MSLRKKIIADLLFGVQIVCAFALGGSQFLRALETLQGVSVSMFATCLMFFVINGRLALKAHRVQPSRITIQVAFMYWLWVGMMALDLAAVAWHGGYVWSGTDTASLALTGVGIAATLAVSSRNGLGQGDPLVRGWIAVFFKSVPQFLLAVKIALEGGAGLPALAVIAGHGSMLVRFGQLYFSIREAGYDRNRIGSAISEVGNILSWMAVTVVWLFA